MLLSFFHYKKPQNFGFFQKDFSESPQHKIKAQQNHQKKILVNVNSTFFNNQKPKLIQPKKHNPKIKILKIIFLQI